MTGEASEPMGIALYKRPRDGAIFAIVSPKTGGSADYLWQYVLDGRDGQVKATLVRRFGSFSERAASLFESGEIEAVVVDDALGYVYYSDEQFGIRKWTADPEAPDARAERATFGLDNYRGDREGLAIYDLGGRTGFLLSSDQIGGGSRAHVFPREGDETSGGHRRVGVVTTTADSTDGLEATSRALPGFPSGLLVMMNSAGRNFQIYRWEDVAAALNLPRGPGQ
jgi:3-phytase